MPSKRHRRLPNRPRRDAMAAQRKSLIDRQRASEFDREVTVSRARAVRCPRCNDSFYAAELNPVCPYCGAGLHSVGGHR